MKKHSFKIITTLSLILIVFFLGKGKSLSKDSEKISCAKDTYNQIDLMRAEWEANLDELVKQEKPASKMVDEAYESMRTYKCWLNYLCDSVTFSSNKFEEKYMKIFQDNPEIVSTYIHKRDSCLPPEELDMKNTSIHFMSSCTADATNNNVPDNIYKNLTMCQQYLAKEFPEYNAEDSSSIEKSRNNSLAMTIVEDKIKNTSSKQESRIISNKLSSIITNMMSLEISMNKLKEKIFKINLIPCYISKCD